MGIAGTTPHSTCPTLKSLPSLDRQDVNQLFAHVGVLIRHVLGVLNVTFCYVVGGVSLLPAGGNFPPHDIDPLVYFEGQVTFCDKSRKRERKRERERAND